MAKKAYISVVHNADGTKTVKDHASKKEAHDEGRKLRAAGKNVNVHNAADAARLGLDPRKTKSALKAFASGGGFDDSKHPRDDEGKFN